MNNQNYSETSQAETDFSSKSFTGNSSLKSNLKQEKCRIVPLYPELLSKHSENTLIVTHKSETPYRHKKTLKPSIKTLLPTILILAGTISLTLTFTTHFSNNAILKSITIILFLTSFHLAHKTQTYKSDINKHA